MIKPVEKPFGTARFLMYPILAWLAAAPLAVAVIFIVQIFEFSHLQMAQASIGAFGFAGGLLHALLIRKTGGKVYWKHAVSLAFVWAFCCMASVTPLFFTSGMPLKMTVLAFYSFSTFGALGGLLTAYTMKGDKERFIAAGCTDYLPKPINTRELPEMISRMLRQRQKDNIKVKDNDKKDSRRR